MQVALKHSTRLFFVILMLLFSMSVFAQENGSDGLGDEFYPQMGNGGYDVQHYTIALDFTPDENFLEGSTTIEAVAEQDLASFNLDFSGMDISSITVNDAEANFDREDSELIITPAETLVADDTFTVVVSYSGVPETVDDPGVPFIGLGWQEWAPGYFAAVSEPSGSMNWFPANNHPLDKATFTFEITVPHPDVVAANGILSSVTENDDDTRTYLWEASDLMASYLAIVAVGDFIEVRDDSGDVPIRNYFPADTPQNVIDAYENTGDMMVFLGDMLGDYPFEVYGVVAVPGFPAALETQTLSIFGGGDPGESTILHELLHQWFGDSVTVAQWKDIWLHEGFATYFEALWIEHTSGEDAYNAYIDGFYDFAAGAGLSAPGSIEIENLFGGTVYVRGALVLHALREEVGDDVFFEILHSFYQTYAYNVATTDDFIVIAEEVSGQELDELFDAWLYGNTVPELEG